MSRKEMIRTLRREWRGERGKLERRIAVLEKALGVIEEVTKVFGEERDLTVAMLASMGRWDELANEELIKDRERSGAAFKRQTEVVSGDLGRFVEHHEYWRGKVAKD